MKKCFLFLMAVCLTFAVKTATAQDSSRLRISLLTCTPGEELYSTFGHSAFRVIDSNSVTDIVYNYGTFNFDDNGFYLKFIRGKLLYYVSTEYFEDFKALYQQTKRGIPEQVLVLDASQKQAIRKFLNENIKEENKYYKYDFFLDNCTTRLRDILKIHKDSSFTNKYVMREGTTFREAIHAYLKKNDKHWSMLGIDLLLGLPCDAVMTAEQQEFLPENLMRSLDSSDVRMVDNRAALYPFEPLSERSFFTPFTVFGLLLAMMIALSFSKSQSIRNLVSGFDGLLYFLTGMLGLIMILMWTATDHSMCRNNFNLLWAWPTHLVAAFYMNSKKSWVRTYFAIYAVCMLILVMAWFFLPQQMNPGLIPMILLLVYTAFRKWQSSR